MRDVKQLPTLLGRLRNDPARPLRDGQEVVFFCWTGRPPLPPQAPEPPRSLPGATGASGCHLPFPGLRSTSLPCRMTVDASPSPEPGREGSLGDAFLPSGLRRIERSPAGGQSRQTAAGQSTGLSGAPPAVGIPNTPPGPRRLHRSASPHGCAMRHTPPYGNTRSSSPPRDDRSHQSPRPRCAAHAYRTPDERGREADPGRGRHRGRPGATGGTLLLLLGPWSSLSASAGLASSPGESTHGFLPVGSEGLGVPPVRGLPRTPSTPPPDSAPAGSSRPDVWDLGRPATHIEGGGPISL